VSDRAREGRGLPIVDDGVGRRTKPGAGASAPVDPMRDIRDEDLFALLTDFYATVERDELLAPYFASVDMAAHMPRIVDFWSTLVFDTKRYTGNAFRPHLEMPGLTAAHFVRWLETMERTIDAHGAGPAAERMKELAHRIAISMQLRLRIAPLA
jgi:hemoglobin